MVDKKYKAHSVIQLILNISLILLAIVLCILLTKEIFTLAETALFNSDKKNYYIFLERILMFFLYFEFIVLILKYFQENYHFPIRYFLYVGITALIRLIIVHHDNPFHTFWYTLSVLVLILGFFIVSKTQNHH